MPSVSSAMAGTRDRRRQRDLVETGLVPEAGDFPNAAFIEFGWAIEPTMRPEPTLGMTLDAALRPTPASCIWQDTPARLNRVYGGADIVSIAMPRQAFRHMVRSLAGYFDRGGEKRSDIFARGPQPNSNFYRAHGGSICSTTATPGQRVCCAPGA